jgi:hypothetical protein
MHEVRDFVPFKVALRIQSLIEFVIRLEGRDKTLATFDSKAVESLSKIQKQHRVIADIAKKQVELTKLRD